MEYLIFWAIGVIIFTFAEYQTESSGFEYSLLIGIIWPIVLIFSLVFFILVIIPACICERNRDV